MAVNATAGQTGRMGRAGAGLAGVALAGAVVVAQLAVLAGPARASEPRGLTPLSTGAGLTQPAAAEAANAPLQILVSLADQTLDVYRGTQLVASSPISSGKPGHSTPTGVFSILEKRKRHFSNLYNNAPMPYMQRLTWSGIALHEGHLPGRPASHGCVRLPRGFAQDLFAMTERGGHVIVTRTRARPDTISHAALPGAAPRATEIASLAPTAGLRPALPGALPPATLTDGEPQSVAAIGGVGLAREPGDKLRILITRNPPVARVREVQRLLAKLDYAPGPVDGVAGRKTRTAITRFQDSVDLPVTGEADDLLLAALYREAGERKPRSGRIHVRRNFKEIYTSDIDLADADAPLGTHLYTLIGRDGPGLAGRWMSVTAAPGEGTDAHAVLDRIGWTDEARAFVESQLALGSSLLVTDQPFRLHSGLGTDFVVMTRQ